MKFRKYLLSLLNSALLIPSITLAQEKINHTISSQVFDGERTVKVFLPKRYENDTLSKFNVIYILDAQSDLFWSMAEGVAGYLIDQYQIAPSILVGIVSESRGSEFSPENSELTEHFKVEIIPFVDNLYRTSKFRIIVGHSWGGAFLGNTLFSSNNDLFSAYLGISPSLDAMDNMLLKMAEERFKEKSNTTDSKIFFATTGEEGIIEKENGLAAVYLDSLVNYYKPSDLFWNYEILDGASHWSCVSPSLNNGLSMINQFIEPDRVVLKNMSIFGYDNLHKNLDQFFARARTKFKYDQMPQAWFWRYLGNDFAQQGDYEMAVQLYSYGFKNGLDESSVPCIEMSENLIELGRGNEAKEWAEKAGKQLEIEKESISENKYKGLKERLKELEF